MRNFKDHVNSTLFFFMNTEQTLNYKSDFGLMALHVLTF